MKAQVPFQLAEISYQTEAAVFGLLGLYRMRDPGIGAGLCPNVLEVPWYLCYHFERRTGSNIVVVEPAG